MAENVWKQYNKEGHTLMLIPKQLMQYIKWLSFSNIVPASLHIANQVKKSQIETLNLALMWNIWDH